MESFTTIVGHSTAEIVEKKSRFIGQLCHVETEDEALAFLEEVRTKHAQARHNVYAYIVRPKSACGNRIRYSDDGEPAKTAGIPVLEALQHAGLENVACVVTRYFGGTLLGTGGLVRAYTQATNAAIDAAQVVTIAPCLDTSLTIPYALYEQVVKLAENCGAKVVQAEFAEDVQLVLRRLYGAQDDLLTKLTELTSGSVQIDESEAFFAAWEH